MNESRRVRAQAAAEVSGSGYATKQEMQEAGIAALVALAMSTAATGPVPVSAGHSALSNRGHAFIVKHQRPCNCSSKTAIGDEQALEPMEATASAASGRPYGA